MNELEDVKSRCDAIEAWYEFMLAYAAQGIADELQSQHGGQLRALFAGAVDAASGLADAYSKMVATFNPMALRQYENFLAVLRADTTKALAAMELVLAQPNISSQLIDNLNASLHVRTMLTDVFLLDELVKLQRSVALES